MIEEDLLNKALTLFVKHTGIELTNYMNQVASSSHVYDAVLQMNSKELFVAEVKRWAQHKNMGLVIDQINKAVDAFNEENQQEAKPLFIADYINPRMAEELQSSDMNYIDIAGNTYIKNLPTFILIEGKKRIQKNKLVTQGRAFNYSGLKVIYTLLTSKEALNANYREIAKNANVALGSVGWVIKDLTDSGYIEAGLIHNKKKIAKRKELIEKWVEAFPLLRNKIFIDEYIVQNSDWWKQAKNTDKNITLGGEYAGAAYTNNLKPVIGAVYVGRENLNDYLVKYRLAKQEDNNAESGQRVQIFDQFWTDGGIARDNQNLAHPILVYAELITSKDPRNREIANELAEKNIFD